LTGASPLTWALSTRPRSSSCSGTPARI